MKRIALSIGLLFSYAFTYCADNVTREQKFPLLQFFEAQDKNGNTPLHNALLDHKKFLNDAALLENPMIDDMITSPSGKASTYTEYLARQKDKKLLFKEALLDKKSSVNQTIINVGAKDTADYNAIRTHSITKTIGDLYASDSNLNIQNNQGKTPLHIAVQCRASKIVSHLLACEANPNVVDKKGFSPLCIAATSTHNNQAIMDLLLERKADIAPLLPRLNAIASASPENYSFIISYLRGLSLEKQKSLVATANNFVVIKKEVVSEGFTASEDLAYETSSESDESDDE